MIKITAYDNLQDTANIEPLSAKRDWMDQTEHNHAYRCFPLTLANQLGWGISFPEDITFMWDGVTSTYPHNVKVLQGQKYCETGRGHSTINFKTNLTFQTENNYTLLSFPVPNMFVDGAQAVTSLLTTSFFGSPLPVAWKITKPYVPITIKAGQPVIAILPISLTELNNSTLDVKHIKDMPQPHLEHIPTYEGAVAAAKEAAEKQIWTDYYRDATDYLGNNLGSHEVKSIKLKVNKYK